MSYAVLQTKIEKPSPDAVKRALRAVDGFADPDALNLCNDAYGIIVIRRCPWSHSASWG